MAVPPAASSTASTGTQANAATQSGRPWLCLELRALPPICAWPAADPHITELLLTDSVAWRRAPADMVQPSEGIVIISANHPEAIPILQVLRNNERSRLLPVGLLQTCETDSVEEDLADCLIKPDVASLSAALTVLADLSQKISDYPEPEDMRSGERRELDALRYLASREIEEITPRMHAASQAGFRYPTMEAMLGLGPIESLEIMNEFAARDYFDATGHERLLLCASCHSSRIIVRELCPQCRVPALEPSPTFHHFSCSHVGLIDSFEHEGLLICPKCSQRLLHIGVDYDMPEAEQACGSCHHRCMEGVIETRCLSCSHRSAPENATDLSLPVFRPTEASRRTALRTWAPLSTPAHLLMSQVKPCDTAVFEFLLEHTRLICERYDRPACLLSLKVSSFGDLYDEVGRPRFGRMLSRIAHALRHHIRTTDAITIGPDETLDILLTETDPETARGVLDRLAEVFAAESEGKLEWNASLEELDRGSCG